MNKKAGIIIGAVALIALTTGVVIYKLKLDTTPPQQAVSAQVDKDSADYKKYATLKGNAFDRAFVADMIAHHQGAVDMAKQALDDAQHGELKTLANNIIADQNTEITKMKGWQTSWGYPSTSSNNMQDHSSMGMVGDMSNMTSSLQGKTGDDFDNAFIEQMMIHHQSAIDMAGPASANAKHQEVKDLAAAIIAAQTSEISQMKQWQKDWGYSS